MVEKTIIFRVKIVISDDLPDDVRAVCQQRSEESYVMLINKSLSEEARTRSFVHEMLHIWNGDFESHEDIDQIELRTHKQVEEIMRNGTY